jgi:hypothetical protein
MAAIAVARGVAGGGCADRVDPCLYRRSFLAAHQGMVSRLAAGVCRSGHTAAYLGALRLCHGGQSGATRCRESRLCEIVARSLQPDGPEAGRDWPDRAYGLDHLPGFAIAAVCGPRCARLGPSPAPSASTHSFERTDRTHATGSNGAGNVARERHSPCFGLRGKSALHHLPDPGDKRAAQSTRTIGTGGQSPGSYRSNARHAAGLSDLSDRRHLRHADCWPPTRGRPTVWSVEGSRGASG